MLLFGGLQMEKNIITLSDLPLNYKKKAFGFGASKGN